MPAVARAGLLTALCVLPDATLRALAWVPAGHAVVQALASGIPGLGFGQRQVGQADWVQASGCGVQAHGLLLAERVYHG